MTKKQILWFAHGCLSVVLCGCTHLSASNPPQKKEVMESNANDGRFSFRSLVEAKRNQLTSVTHMHFGADEKGRFMPIIHLKEAFHGDLDDPRTRWAAVDATQAIEQPIERSVQQLDDVNQNIQQIQLMREAELSQQRGMGMSMSR